MSLDAYSLCPGGTGKKIKFCCGEFLAELQKIDRMIEGEQFLACLKHIDRLMEQEPGRDRPCLLANKCMLLRATEQYQAASATAIEFLSKHPENQIALSECALHASETHAKAALAFVLKAIRVAGGALSGRTYQAMGMVAGALLQGGFPLPARAMLELQVEIAGNGDDRAGEVLSAFCRAADIPLLLRGDQPLSSHQDAAPWKGRLDEALQPIAMGDWQAGVERLAALAAEVDDAADVWRNLATIRGWMADNPGCIEALHKYAALRTSEENGLEDAVEAEATAMFLSDDPLGDRLDVFKVVWTVKNVELAQEAFLSVPRLRPIPFDPAQFSDGQTPPPKGAYSLFDRPMPESAEGLTVETAPCLLGQALLFGRQTDREARLEVIGVTSDELQAVKQLVDEVAGDALEPNPTEETIDHWSATQKLLRATWQPPQGTSPEKLREMLAEHARNAILDKWPDLKLGALDGRTPREAAGDPQYRVRVLAAIMVLEHWSQRLPGAVDLNDLRSRLGLPTLGPIDPQQQPVAELSIVRLARLNVELLSDDDLVMSYYRAGAYSIRPAMRAFATAIIGRPSMADSGERLHAYASLARTEEDMAKALEYIAEGRRAAEAKKISTASWDLMDLSLSFARHDGQGAMRIIEHIQKHHLEEPGVGETLTRMLIDVGLLRPDGTPAFGPQGPEPAMAEEAAGEPGGLWTPDSAQPGSGGGKLWTPE